MSHATHLGKSWIAIHDGSPDMDSEVILRKVNSNEIEIYREVCIPFSCLLKFVAEIIRIEKIAKLEQAEPPEVFNL